MKAERSADRMCGLKREAVGKRLVAEADAVAASEVIRSVMEGAARPAVDLSVPLGVEVGTGPSWGAAH